jgi:hypothetical protein
MEGPGSARAARCAAPAWPRNAATQGIAHRRTLEAGAERYGSAGTLSFAQAPGVSRVVARPKASDTGFQRSLRRATIAVWH